MRVYQCIHNYALHIPQFEARNGIDDRSTLTFGELRRLVIQDGYASCYVLHPALQDPDGDVFFTIWNYERLQRLWAREHGMATTDLDVIRRAQIEHHRPHVVYNMSAYYDRAFARETRDSFPGTRFVCWNAIIEDRPTTVPGYDAHFTLHRPYVNWWRQRGVRAFELQPGIPSTWLNGSRDRDRTLDVLFYGQVNTRFFNARNRIVDELALVKEGGDLDVELAIQFWAGPRTIFRVPGIPWLTLKRSAPPARWTRHVVPPLYGRALYDRIAGAKLVVNTCTDFNGPFKSNMRVFETIGHGALLVSESGDYPDGLEEGRDYIGYDGATSLAGVLRSILGDWPRHRALAAAAQDRVARLYGKERQWNEFRACLEAIP